MGRSNKSGKFLFIAGFLLSASIVPIINSATVYVQSLLELDIQKKTVDLKKYISNNEEAPKKTSTIGFDGSGKEDKDVFYCQENCHTCKLKNKEKVCEYFGSFKKDKN